MGYITFDKLDLPVLQELSVFSRTIVKVTSVQSVTVDVGPVLPGQLPQSFRVNQYYVYDGFSGHQSLMVSQQVTLVPLQGLGRAARGLTEGRSPSVP